MVGDGDGDVDVRGKGWEWEWEVGGWGLLWEGSRGVYNESMDECCRKVGRSMGG